MPFLRFSRDKRGYEHTYLVHTATRRGKPSKPRLLYWYRTPPGVKVGRPAFDEEIRRTLEAQYPGIAFDWEALVATPMPSAEPEYWRERRRIERAAKQARNAEDEDAFLPDGEGPSPVLTEPTEQAAAVAEKLPEPNTELAVQPRAEGQGEVAPPTVNGAESAPRKRRRRGGRRRRGRSENPVTVLAATSAEAVDLPDPDNRIDPLEPAEDPLEPTEE